MVGEIVAAFGIRGQLKVRSLTDRVDHLLRKIKQIYVGPQRQPYKVKDLFEHKPGLLVLTLDGVASRADAENLRGAEITLLETQLAPLGKDEYFLHDLYGMEVVLETGESFGKVREIIQTGANDVLVVARPDQPDALLPVIHDVVITMDTAHKRVVVRLLDGLLAD